MIIDPQLYYYFKGKWFTNKWQLLDYAYTNYPGDFDINIDARCVIGKNFGFENCDWTKEPTQSWEDMTLNRMLQIRDYYSKLCLFYTGGADSHFILHLCLKHNIKLDEICTIKTNLKGLPNDWFNWEFDNFAIPFVKEHCKDTVINIEKFSDWSLYTEPKKGFTINGRVFERGSQIFTTPTRGAYTTIIDKYVDRGFVIIHGATEPKVLYDKEKDKYYAEIWDVDNFVDRCGSPNIVSFYTDPAVPQMHIKQCHMVKNQLRKLGITDTDNSLYKTISCNATRNGFRISNKSPQFVKTTTKSHPIFKTKKELLFFSALQKGDKIISQRYLHFLSTPFKGRPMYTMPKGVLVGRWYIE